MSNPEREIFVFGSNQSGLHGAGSAKAAYEKFGARMGVGIGLIGNSYAIPTKDRQLDVLSLEDISRHVANFLKFAAYRRTWKFNIVDIGTGLAGYKAEQIAPLFKGATENCNFIGKLKEMV